MNDLNVLHRGPLVSNLLKDSSPKITWTCNGRERNFTYYLTDGIYPKWRIFVRPFSHPKSPKEKYYSRCQEAVRKDVERAFGVLQARWHILANPARVWTSKKMGIIVKACIIMHNMIVADSGYNVANVVAHLDDNEDQLNMQLRPSGVAEIAQRLAVLEDRGEHLSLENDLMQHLWNKAGDL